MRYALAKYVEHMETKTYRIYLCDSIFNALDGNRMKYRYSEVINQKYEPADMRTGEEIAEDIITRAGISFE